MIKGPEKGTEVEVGKLTKAFLSILMELVMLELPFIFLPLF